MQALNSFANHVSGLPTQTIETGAHRFHSRMVRSSGRSVSAYPTKLLFGNPSLLSTRGSYPNSAFAAGMNYGQAPLSFKVQYISVRNKDGFNWINNLNNIVSQNELGFNPKDVDQSAKNDANYQISNDLQVIFNYPETVDGEERNQYVRSTSPSKVAAGPKGFIHHPSIAGERK